jgi:4-diphosphocytidyl-2-C-methyl-D-erythritol kinase
LIEPGPSRWPAPAKINLFLHVIRRRQDGYHDIQTLFQLIDLCDELQIEVTKSGKIVRPQADYGVSEHEDLVVRAARLLQAETGTRLGARIKVHKRIPIGAGLGGGSTDAATTLLVLNHLWRCKLGVEALARLGISLGADIPLFIHGRSALASGIGEQLTPLNLGTRHYVLVFNQWNISTAQVFSHPQLKRNASPISVSSALSGAGRNDCEAVVCALYPEFKSVLAELAGWGKPRMTGTGSCIFLPMSDENAAKSAAREINCRYNVLAVRGLDRSPVHQILGLPVQNA